MENDRLIRKIKMDCPICDKVHEVEERKRTAVTTIKGEKVSYEERFYFCADADAEENEFETGAMTNENLLNARNAYRQKKGLLTSGEIIEIQESYGLSQVDLARLLRWGEATVSRYESKAIQDEAYDVMLRLIKDNPLQTLEFLHRNSGKFSLSKKSGIKKKIMEKLDSYGKEFLARQRFEGEYAAFDEPSDLNGYKLLDIDKIEMVISYLAEHVPNLFKVKLMKMLWYSDALSYKQNGAAMTGLVYKHETMGALPIGHYNLMTLENVNVKEELSYNYDSMFHIYPASNADYSILSSEDRRTLDMVITKFRNYKASDIVAYMHKEKAYTETLNGEVISFELAKRIREFDSFEEGK